MVLIRPGRRGASTLALLLVQVGSMLAASDWSCAGGRYGGIDWDDVRTTLGIYADKYLDRPQLLAKEFVLASQYAVEYHPENRCVLGDLALRLLLWLRADRDELREAVGSLSGSRPLEIGIEPLLEETYRWFWDLQVAWSDIMASGWPIFSLFAVASGILRDEGRDPCVPEAALRLYVDSFDDAIYVPGYVDVQIMTDASHCLDAKVSAMLSLADGFRLTGSAVGAKPLGNRYYLYSATPIAEQPLETDTAELLAMVEKMLRQNRSWTLLTTRWPVWRLLDRLSAAEVVNVSSGAGSFWMYVFPHRVRSDGLISNRIRSTHRAYCLQLFQDEVLRLASEGAPRGPLRLVEAGPHIGDCLLWAAAALGPGARGLAVEPIAQVVDRFRRSIAANGFDIDLRHAWLGDKATMEHVPRVRLDDLLDEDVDVFKIHTNGGERAILDGAAGLFTRRQVRVVIVHSAEPHQLWGSASFLLERGYTVRVGDWQLSLHDELPLKQRVAERGGLQLHAVA